MKLDEAKRIIEATEARLLHNVPFVIAHTFEREKQRIHIGLTPRLRKKAKKVRVWKSKKFLTAFKNAQYGIEDEHIRSRGGADGIFLLDRGFRPKNEMMKKIFDRYIDNPEGGINEILSELGVELESIEAVRIVSHHLRLLGIMYRELDEITIILIDIDMTK